MGRLQITATAAAIVLLGAVTVSSAQAFTSTSTTAKKSSKPHAKAVQSTSSHSAKSKHSTSKAKHGKKRAGNWRNHGQQAIDSQRAREIQEALIREHYLQGESSGRWDDETQQAMRRYQAENGWQSKNVPDARALIKLGLGPDHQHLLNPESAMTSQPASQAAPGAASPATPANANQPQK